MNYKLLQAGEMIQEGDEWWAMLNGWLQVPQRDTGDIYSQANLDDGLFVRRPVRRDLVEVMAEEEDQYGLWVTADGEDIPDRQLHLEHDHTYVSCPITYAQKLVDAIKEVAGL